jgi:hypothetical protein
MSHPEDLPEDFLDLADGYCSGLLGDDGLRRLEAQLLASPAARRAFVSYFQMHTELEFAVRARKSASAALDQMDGDGCGDGNCPADTANRPGGRRAGSRTHVSLWYAVAAGVLIAVGAYALGNLGQPSARPAREAVSSKPTAANVAWLVNAQDCEWTGGGSEMPGRDMQAGKTLRLRRGLAEIEFDRGARLILQGPASLELISGNEARLLSGSLTARVPKRALGFTVFSPRGKVVDLGTEFGLSVEESGATAVRVFEGKVVASPNAAAGVTLYEDQAARIDGPSVALSPDGARMKDVKYVRAIVPPPVVTPRTSTLDFNRHVPGTLLDAEGRGVGLTHRLPGTGGDLGGQDGNLRLNTTRKALELTTTRSDINTQQGMEEGEYLGFRLSDLGFTGSEDFSVSATIPKIPGLESVGQFGLYAGARSDRNIRGGLIRQIEPDRYLAFLVNNDGGRDSDLNEVGLVNTGDDLRLTLRRVSGAYSLEFENLTRHSSSTLAIAHPAFLDNERDLYVGLFGANTQSDVRKTLTIKEFGVSVSTVSTPEGTLPTRTPQADPRAE